MRIPTHAATKDAFVEIISGSRLRLISSKNKLIMGKKEKQHNFVHKALKLEGEFSKAIPKLKFCMFTKQFTSDNIPNCKEMILMVITNP